MLLHTKSHFQDIHAKWVKFQDNFKFQDTFEISGISGQLGPLKFLVQVSWVCVTPIIIGVTHTSSVFNICVQQPNMVTSHQSTIHSGQGLRVSTNLTEQISRRLQEGLQEKSKTCLHCFGLLCNVVPNLLHLMEHVMMSSKFQPTLITWYAICILYNMGAYQRKIRRLVST